MGTQRGSAPYIHKTHEGIFMKLVFDVHLINETCRIHVSTLPFHGQGLARRLNDFASNPYLKDALNDFLETRVMCYIDFVMDVSLSINPFISLVTNQVCSISHKKSNFKMLTQVI